MTTRALNLNRSRAAAFLRRGAPIALGVGLTLSSQGQKLFYESFDALPFGPNVEEASAGTAVWTKTPPTGWVIDDSQMPGFGTPEYAANDGRREWAGWSFADARWWPTVDNQRRAEFLLATGGAAIADPDEWDDATHLKGLFNSFLSTPEIAVTGKTANSLVLAFDSSWRPEGHDDGGANWPVDENGDPVNNQTAIITAQWDNGTPVEVLRWDSYPSDGEFFHPDAPNESVVVELKNPGNAQKLKLKLAMVDSANDWWWAVDNVAVGEPPLMTGLSGSGIGFTARIREALGKTVNESQPITATLDGQAVTVAKTRDADVNELLLLNHDQSPKIFVPRSTHTVELAFTATDGRKVTDTGTFVAPGYTAVGSTPTTVSATISETSYLTVDESKGVKFELDGSAVTGLTVSREDLTAADGSDAPDRITVRYAAATPFASSSSHTLKVTFTTKTAQEVVETLSFTAPAYTTLPTALGTAMGTGADAGIRWRTHQLEAARPNNNIADSERQLAGELGASVHDTSGQNASGYFEVTYVNFDQNAGDAGNFNASSAIADQAVQDEMIPGIPGTSGSIDNIAAEGLAYVEVPAPGIYSMVVNSDDGFQVSVGNATNPKYLVLGQFDAGRGQADTSFYFKADAAGVYLFRLLYFEGGGDARVEWFTVKADGTRALVNGGQTGALKAFKRRTVAEPSLPSEGGGTSVGQKLFYESFDALPFGPNVEEASAGTAVWTKTPPTGWVIDDSQMPGFGTPEYAANDGRREWAGWSFADARWWPTVDNQRRAEFLLATGGAAIADPDEWDDATHLKGLFNSFLSTPEIAVTGKTANSLVLAFDSSWRPEGHDDGGANWPVDENGDPVNNQTAIITAQWDNGTPVEVLRWDSYPSDGEFFHPDAPNESVVVELKNPGNAQKLKLKLAMVDSANDWWWAVDNVAVGEPPLLTGLSGSGIGFTARIREALGKTVNENQPITAKLDGQTVTVTKSRDGEMLLVTHDQSPKIFVPRSTHKVDLAFTTGEGKQATDSAEFVAPGYTAVGSTPTTVTATISETDYLTVDESKGVKFELDGSAVTGLTVSREDLTTADGSDAPDRLTVRYTASTPFASGSSHTLKVTFTTKTAQEVVETLAFTAPDYVLLPGALATAVGTGADAGLRWRTHQLEASRPNNNIADSEKQLAGELGVSVHDTSSQNASGYFEVPFVNFDQNAGDAGNFNASSTIADQAVQDELIPGIPGTTGSIDNIAAEGLAYVEIPAPGVYTMVVNSDDGFQVSVGNATNPKYVVLGQFDAGRGQADTAFYFRADTAGVYLFRLLYFEGGGDARVEWFTVKADGTRALVNGTQTGALKAYKRRTVAEPSIPTGNPTLGISRAGANVTVTYTGTLQSADQAAGPYQAVSGATSPFVVPTTAGAKFYRSQQ